MNNNDVNGNETPTICIKSVVSTLLTARKHYNWWCRYYGHHEKNNPFIIKFKNNIKVM